MTLPFVVAPRPVQLRRIGNEVCGVLEVAVKGGLTVGEGDLISELLEDQQSTFVLKAKAAEVIASSEGFSLLEGKALVDKVLEGDELEPEAQEIADRHQVTLDNVAMEFRRFVKKYRAAAVTALIRFRLGQPEWSLEQTATLDPVLFEGLYQLANDEQAAENDGKPTPAPTEEELGKQPGANGKSRGRTGGKSSGDSATPSPDSSIAELSLTN